MLHLNSSCISDIENIESILKKKDYYGIKENREIKKIFEDISLAFKLFSNSLKKIHKDGETLLSSIQEKKYTDNSGHIYFASCFTNVISLIRKLYEENLSVSEQIEKSIVLELEKEEQERIEDINVIYKEEDTRASTVERENSGNAQNADNCLAVSGNDDGDNAEGETYDGEIFVDDVPLCSVEIHLKTCLENEMFADEYLNHPKYKKHFAELDKLNIKLDKEITSFKELMDKFGKNANKLLIQKSQERISSIQHKKKSVLEFLYDSIKELKSSKKHLRNGVKDLKQYVEDNSKKKEKQKKTGNRDDRKASSGGSVGIGESSGNSASPNHRGDGSDFNDGYHGSRTAQGKEGERVLAMENLHLEKFEIREKHRIEKVYESIRTFVKILSVRNIMMNKVLYSKSNEISTYDSLIHYQGWLSTVLKKDVDITNLQKKIPKNDILTKEEQFLLMPYGSGRSADESQHGSEKKRKIPNSNFQRGELIYSENDTWVENARENANSKVEVSPKGDISLEEDPSQDAASKNQKSVGGEAEGINSRRDSQFPEEFYIPVIIKMRNVHISDGIYANARGEAEKDSKHTSKPCSRNFTCEDPLVKEYLNDDSMDKEKDIFTFLTNRQKDYERYLLHFNNVNILSPVHQNGDNVGVKGEQNNGITSRNSERKCYKQNFFQGYFNEEGHIFYPFKIPTGMNNFSSFENITQCPRRYAFDFGEEDMNEYDYKLMAYESILLVYYSLSIQLNCYFLFDVCKRNNRRKYAYKKVYEKCSDLVSSLKWGYTEKGCALQKGANIVTNVEMRKNVSLGKTIGANVSNGYSMQKKYEEISSSAEESRSTIIDSPEDEAEDYFQYVDYIYNVKLQNFLLVKRIISIYRIKLGLNSRTNDLITLLTIPSHYFNYGNTYTFHVLDVRFRIIRIIESLNFDHFFHFDVEKKKKRDYQMVNCGYEYGVYMDWLKRQLHLLYISLYLKFNHFAKFIPYFNISAYPDIMENFSHHSKITSNYFTYVNKSKDDNSFVRYIKKVHKKFKKIQDSIIIKMRKKEKIEFEEDKGENIHPISFSSLKRDEKIIFICNFILKNFIKSFRIIILLKSIVKKNKWNYGQCDEKILLSNLIKYFTKIEYFDYEIRNIFFSHFRKKNEKNSDITKMDTSGDILNDDHNRINNLHIKNKTYEQANYDEIFRTIFFKELGKRDDKSGDYTLQREKFTAYDNNKRKLNQQDRDKENKGEKISIVMQKRENNNPFSVTKGSNNNNFHKIVNMKRKTKLTKKEKKIRNKIFYKLNIESVLCSSWFIDRIFLHFFLYFYISCTIDSSSKTNMYADTPYILQGIMFIIYYLQSGNDITLKRRKNIYCDGLESTLIPISTFILYFIIHFFYSFFDKNQLVIYPNEVNNHIELFLNRKLQNIVKQNESSYESETYSCNATKNHIITVQSASKLYYIIKNFEHFISYRTIDEKMFQERDNKINLDEVLCYEDESNEEITEENENNMSSGSEEQKGKEKKNRKSTKKKKKKGTFLFCGTIPKDTDNIMHSPSVDENTKKCIQREKIKEKAYTNDMIYLKRYCNILYLFNYNHLENLLTPNIPSLLSFYLNDDIYSNDNFFDIFMLRDEEGKNLTHASDKPTRKLKKGSNQFSTDHKERAQNSLNSLHSDMNFTHHTVQGNGKKNNPICAEGIIPEGKYAYITNVSREQLVIKYNCRRSCNGFFSLINMSKIEKVIMDIIFMRMISCDFRNHLLLLLCNYRKFIDMYSLSYILNIFIILHKFFTINSCSMGRLNKYRESIIGRVTTMSVINNKCSQNGDFLESGCNIYIEDEDNRESIYPPNCAQVGVQRCIGNFPCKKEKDGNKKLSKDNGEILNRKSNCVSNSSNSSRNLSSYLKFFIYNSVKSIFHNIVCSAKDEDIRNVRDNPFDAVEDKDYSQNKCENDMDDKTGQDEEEKTSNRNNHRIIKQYVDIINKYINEIIMEILFFSNIWKEFLPLEEHPLTVLHAANKTLHHEVVKFIKTNKNNSELLFSESLSIIVSLYNFNLLNKEIVLQTRKYVEYRSGWKVKEKNAEKDNEADNTEKTETGSAKQRSRGSKMENKILHYYENRNSIRAYAREEDGKDGSCTLPLFRGDDEGECSRDGESGSGGNREEEDVFINLSLIISKSNDPCMVKLMFKLEKIFVKIIDKKLEHNKYLLSECLKNEKLIPLNGPDVLYNSTTVDIFSIISNILEILFQYKCPVEWIMTPFLEFLNNFINEYCENCKRRYGSFIISVLNQYADKYFNELLNLTEQQRIPWEKYSCDKKKRYKKSSDMSGININNNSEHVNIFKSNELNILDRDEEDMLYDENIEHEFDDVNEITKRIKHKKKKKNVLYKLFDYDEIPVNAIKNKMGELLEDINDLSNKVTNFQSSNVPKGKTTSDGKRQNGNDEDDEYGHGTDDHHSEEEKQNIIKERGSYMSDDLVNIIDEINYLFNDSDMSSSLVIIWNLYFYLEQLSIIRNKFQKYILQYICTRTNNVDKISLIFNNYTHFEIDVNILKKNIYTKTIFDILDTSLNNIKNTLNNTLYYIFKVLSIRIICYEFQEEMFYNLYEPFDLNNVKNVVSIFPTTIEKFFIQIPEIYFKSILTVFIELFIKMWMLIIIEKGFSNFVFNDNDIHIMKRDNTYIKKYIEKNEIELSHNFLTKKYNVNEYIDAFLDTLYGDRDMFSGILNDQRGKKPKNIVSSAYNKGMAIITGINQHIQ
ncbi:conserved Plasmodium protein, unknown function [Plasmodium ovale]|uniref:Uncharacterized protein n=1 Tax=Plasmodium ovale TaxID=36330 RepID=A0A1D3TK12_PLAOA|nr:conserved Plasmodium protein, unknown function [Plasmodium ovale]